MAFSMGAPVFPAPFVFEVKIPLVSENQIPEYFPAVLRAVVLFYGLVIGSFLNVVIYRLPRGLSTIFPRSRCPRCRVAIRPLDNIPVFSFLFLGGRCRRCGLGISWRYPAIELLTGLLFLLCLNRFLFTPHGLIAAFFCCLMVVLAMIDFDHYILPDVITLPGIAIGLMLQPWIPWVSTRDALWGAALGAGVLFALVWGWYLWKGVWGMGLGDVKMLAMVGAFLGWQGALITLFLASLAGSLVGGLLILVRRMDMQSKLPFGVFLAIAALYALFFGASTLDLYWGAAAQLFGP